MVGLSWEEFEKVEMHTGRVISVEDFPQARNPSYVLTIDFGTTLGVLRSVAAIAIEYKHEALVGRLVVAVTNFPPKQIANRMSQALVLAAVNADGSLRLLQPDGEVELGARVK
ncbi:MAG: tRNA-binding protein [Anaerolineales bacterium]|nr:tRNA-binding protein [Anaerolineales bacterium]